MGCYIAVKVYVFILLKQEEIISVESSAQLIEYHITNITDFIIDIVHLPLTTLNTVQCNITVIAYGWPEQHNHPS